MNPFDDDEDDVWPTRPFSWNDVMEPTPLAPPECLQIVSCYPPPLFLTPSSGDVGQLHAAALADLFASSHLRSSKDDDEPNTTTLEDSIMALPLEQERDDDGFSPSIPDINLAGFSADMPLPGTTQESPAMKHPTIAAIKSTAATTTTTSTTTTTCTTTWRMRFEELCAFVHAHGHAAVPSHYPPNVKLSHWVKRQRAAAKSINGLSTERKALLDQVGFVWDVQSKLWDFRYQQLIEFAMQYGHCRVPANQRTYRELAVWVKCQRRQYTLREQGRSNHLTQSRIHRLEAIGFSWAPSKEKDWIGE